jgi:hypothetical protein
MKRTTISLFVFACMFAAQGILNAQPAACSNSTLQGGYGFFVHATILPAGTPRSIIGRLSFDGKGGFTNVLTFNDNGVVTQLTDSGTYTVSADSTGRIFTNGSTKTIEIVVVDGGNESYQLRTDDPHILFVFNAAKKQLPTNNNQD